VRRCSLQSTSFVLRALPALQIDRQSRDLESNRVGTSGSLGYTGAVSSEDCLQEIVTRADIVDREAGNTREQDSHVGLVYESARSAGPPRRV
jgi:hypothetical protein